MVLLSKALSGGYVPLAAVLMRRAIFDAVFTSVESGGCPLLDIRQIELRHDRRARDISVSWTTRI